ncbi:hypothetical protein [Chromobacterium sp.]|uniref:hypothetical protein n=1 Tax=Chromobacterium sp. TaxID=306190 RepID=UPI0035AE34D3
MSGEANEVPIATLSHGFYAENERASNQVLPIVPSFAEDGSVQYQNYQFNEAPSQLKGSVEVGRNLLNRFVGLVSGTVNRQAEARAGASAKYDFALWREAFTPVMSSFFDNARSNNRVVNKVVRGVDVAKAVIEFNGGVTTNELEAFSRFLRYCGSNIQRSVQWKGSSRVIFAYSTHSFSGDLYKPSIHFYSATVDRSQLGILSSCGSMEPVSLQFNVNYVSADFNINSYLNDARFKQEVDWFISRFESESLAQEGSYFDDVFHGCVPLSN